MELADALTITALGMAVVFSGLLLTAGLIVVFGQIHRLLERPDEPVAGAATVRPTAEPGEPIDDDVLCVITTVLEIERRLHRLSGRRTTGVPVREPAHD
jgi:Na+-transporting methylmalonyl-CoA/oxaloacetate decarboxylase gamma subunit